MKNLFLKRLEAFLFVMVVLFLATPVAAAFILNGAESFGSLFEHALPWLIGFGALWVGALAGHPDAKADPKDD